MSNYIQLALLICRFCIYVWLNPWMWRDDCTIPLYMRDLSISGFGVHGGPGTNAPCITRDDRNVAQLLRGKWWHNLIRFCLLAVFWRLYILQLCLPLKRTVSWAAVYKWPNKAKYLRLPTKESICCVSGSKSHIRKSLSFLSFPTA